MKEEKTEEEDRGIKKKIFSYAQISVVQKLSSSLWSHKNLGLNGFSVTMTLGNLLHFSKS